jgi:hypothetical protein
VLRNDVNGNSITCAARHDDIGVTLEWVDELVIGRLDKVRVLMQHRLERTAALTNVTQDSAREPGNMRVRTRL